MNKINTYAIFGIMFLGATLLASGMYSSQIFAFEENGNAHDQNGNLNEAEINADIEQENKCKKDTECENENEINNLLNITTITTAAGAANGNGNGNEEDPCSDCFKLQNEGGPWQQNQLTQFEEYIASNPIQYTNSDPLSTIEELCAFLNSQNEPVSYGPIANALIAGVDGYQSVIDQLEQCLEDAGLVFAPV